MGRFRTPDGTMCCERCGLHPDMCSCRRLDRERLLAALDALVENEHVVRGACQRQSSLSDVCDALRGIVY